MPRAPDERVSKAKELFDQGIKLKEISEALGVPEGTIRSWKNRYQWDCNVANKIRNVANEKKKKKSKAAEEAGEPEEDCELTEKQQLFCCFYVKYFNATKAYQKAYGADYKTAMAAGSRMLRNVKIKSAIQKLKQGRINRAMLSGDDIFQKYMDIAFADITDYLSFGREQTQATSMHGPINIKDPKTGEEKPLMKTVNTVKFKESTEVDGTIISEVKQGRDGTSIKLADRMKALQWLSDHMDLATAEQKARIDLLKAQANKAAESDTLPEGGITFQILPASAMPEETEES